MSPLSPLCEQLLGTLVDAPLAWQSPAQLAARIRLDLELVLDLVADLDAGGWLEVWDREVDLVVTLTPLAVEVLGVRLIEVGPTELPRWARSDHPDPPPPRPRGVFESWQDLRLARLVDPRPTPEESAIAAEEEALAPLPAPCTTPNPIPLWPSRSREDALRLERYLERRRGRLKARADARRRKKEVS